MAARPSEREAWALLLSIDGLGPAGFGGLVATFGSGGGILDGCRATRREPDDRPSGRGGAGPADRRRRPRRADRPDGPRSGAGARDPPRGERRHPDAGRSRLPRSPPVDRPAAARAAPARRRSGPVRAPDDRRSSGRGGRPRRDASSRRGSRPPSAAAAGSSSPGLAVGIDGAAHAAAAEERRPTIAVLGSGHERLYPRAHRRLARDIVATGGIVVSERFPDGPPTRGSFPQRNRLISGLADVTIVVEAGQQSGALITARSALEQGRECYVVPGPDGRAALGGLPRALPGVSRPRPPRDRDPRAARGSRSRSRRDALAERPAAAVAGGAPRRARADRA